MNTKSPHLAIIALVYSAIHFTQSGVDFIQQSRLGKDFPVARRASEVIATISAWLFIVYVVPRGARLILATYEVCGKVADSIFVAGRRQAARLLKWALGHLDDDNSR